MEISMYGRTDSSVRTGTKKKTDRQSTHRKPWGKHLKEIKRDRWQSDGNLNVRTDGLRPCAGKKKCWQTEQTQKPWGVAIWRNWNFHQFISIEFTRPTKAPTD
jgi:hypothetical protein